MVLDDTNHTHVTVNRQICMSVHPTPEYKNYPYLLLPFTQFTHAIILTSVLAFIRRLHESSTCANLQVGFPRCGAELVHIPRL